MSQSRFSASGAPRRFLLLAASVTLLAAPTWSAQLPTIVKDINTYPAIDLSSLPVAHTLASTKGGHPHGQHYVRVGGKYFFSAMNFAKGRELYVSDGTANGTTMVKDINPGAGNGLVHFSIPSFSSSLMAVGSKVFFLGDDGTHGYELWVSDGTSLGTRLVKDIRPGTASSSPVLGGVLNRRLFFSADDGVNGAELWVSNGTAAGTVMLRDINPRGLSSSPANFTEFGNRILRRLYFAATGPNGRELWVTDGTANGTFEFKNIGPVLLSSNPTCFLPIGLKLFFQARGASGLPSLWVSNGTAPGTVEVRPRTLSDPTYFVALNGKLIFQAKGANGEELWVSDGTANGTFELKNIRGGTLGSFPSHMTALGNQVFFSAFDDRSRRVGLWVTDGTAQGTMLAAPTYTVTGPSFLTADPTNKKLYFRGKSMNEELFVYDTVAKRASRVKNINLRGGSLPMEITLLAPGKIVFSANNGNVGHEPWVSDGTANGTNLLKNINLPGTRDARVAYITEMNGLLYFRADDGVNSAQLWVSNGTAAGTRMLKKIGGHSPFGSFLSYITRLGNKLIFAANDGTNGTELWESDGTPPGTKMLKGIRTGALGSDPALMFRFGNRILFQADDGTNGRELWITDGTPNGTRMVKNIRPGLPGSNPNSFAAVAGKVVFQADDGIAGRELWETDGTKAGTRLLKDIRPGTSGSAPSPMSEYKGKVCFAAYSGATPASRELWETDGTRAGTRMLKKFAGNPFSGSPQYFAEMGGLLYFDADDGTTGIELWVTDGTAQGTKPAVDIRTGPSGSGPRFITAVGSRRLYFAASDTAGSELWKSDGTKSGTRRLGDMNTTSFFPNNISDGRSRFAVLNDHLYFTGNDGLRGIELWKMKNGATAHPIHEDCKTHVVSMRATDPVLGGTLKISGSTGVTRPIVVLPLGFRASLASPLGSGCLSYLDLGLGIQVLMATGLQSWTYSVPVPSDTSLSGATVAIQAWTFPPTFLFNQLELSNAVTLTLGN